MDLAVDYVILSFASGRKGESGRNDQFRLSMDHIHVDASIRFFQRDIQLSFAVDLHPIKEIP